MNIAIIGLGLMGGSLALSLKKQDYVSSIVGYDHNQLHQTQAIELGLVNEIVSFESIKKADVIFLAIPVNGVIAVLKELQDISNATTIIDLGSTKAKSLPPSLLVSVKTL